MKLLVKLFTFAIIFIAVVVNNRILAEETIAKIDKNSNKITLNIPITESQNAEVKQETKSIKIDDNTTAKITISTKNNIKNVDANETDANKVNKNSKLDNENVKNDDKIPSNQTSLSDDKKNILINEKKEKEQDKKQNKEQNSNQNENQASKDKTVNIKTVYDPNQQNIITINDGEKNINIKIDIDCNNCCKIKKTNNAKNSKQNNAVVLKNKKKVNINKSKKPKKTNKTLDHKKNNSKKVTANTTSVERPQEKDNIYIINRIINLSEDAVLTEEDLQKITLNNDIEKNITQNDNAGQNSDQQHFSYSKTNNKNTNKFKQKYDSITSNQMNYGEIAFIDDYNN